MPLIYIILGIIVLVPLILVGKNISIWINARSAGVPISITELLFIRLRRIDVEEFIRQMIRLRNSNVQVTVEEAQTHLMSGGSLNKVANAVISSKQAGIKMGFKELCAIDLAGRDVQEAVRDNINPRVIMCPTPTKGDYVIGVAKDGIRIGVRVKVTVRTDIYKIIGSAGDKTIIARVGEKIIATVGAADDHRNILKDPKKITENILESGLASSTAFEIVSVDIEDIQVFDNIGAKLASDQSVAQKKIADALAESQRAEAIATGQEMKARIKDMQSQLVLSKSTLPNAIATSLQEGNIGVRFAPCPTIFDSKDMKTE